MSQTVQLMARVSLLRFGDSGIPTSTVFEAFGELETELRSALSQRGKRPARQYEAGEPHLTETLASRISRLRGELQDLDTLVEENLLQHQGGDEGWNAKGASLFSERVGVSPTEFRHEIQAVKADLETVERSEKVTSPRGHHPDTEESASARRRFCGVFTGRN